MNLLKNYRDRESYTLEVWGLIIDQYQWRMTFGSCKARQERRRTSYV